MEERRHHHGPRDSGYDVRGSMVRSPGADIQLDACPEYRGECGCVDSAGQRAYRIFAGCPNLVMDLQIDAVLEEDPAGITGSGEYEVRVLDPCFWRYFVLMKRNRFTMLRCLL